MKIKIYQITSERDPKRLCFMNFDYITEHSNGIIPAEIYECVFAGEVEAENLEDVFVIFNMKHPESHKGRSLSVSDVVETETAAGSKFFFCDTIGFKEIEFDKSSTAKRMS